MITIKLDHNKNNLIEALFISNKRADELRKIYYKILSEKNTTTISETIEEIWNNKETTILEKIFMTFIEGATQGDKPKNR